MFLGTLASEAEEIASRFREQGRDMTVVNARFAAPFDRNLIKELAANHSLLVTMEEGVKTGGFGEHVSSFVMEEELPMHVMTCALNDTFIPHGTDRELRKKYGLSTEEIISRIEHYLKRHES